MIRYMLLALCINGCSYGQSGDSKTSLSPESFANTINQYPEALVIDVRTPEEFGKGHLPDAVNYNWNGDQFDDQISTLTKEDPVFVYCLSGARSASAALKMRNDGFAEVYELEGGIIKWRASGFPEVNGSMGKFKGMSREEFDALLATEKLVLIDFFADWCEPCKKMKPYLEEISRDMSATVKVERINADNHQAICRELAIDALPVLLLYQGQKLIWRNSGYISKEDVLKHLR